MFRSLRNIHKWVGLFSSVFLALIAFTGFLLAIKKKANWIQPPTQKGEKVEQLREVASIDQIAAAALALGLPELKTHDDIDRFEFHVSKNTFKITSKEGFREVQVEAKTGKVLSTGTRNDQMFEKIHDLSFFHPSLHEWVLPVVAVSLFVLGISGVIMFSVPIFRRWKYRRKQA